MLSWYNSVISTKVCNDYHAAEKSMEMVRLSHDLVILRFGQARKLDRIRMSFGVSLGGTHVFSSARLKEAILLQNYQIDISDSADHQACRRRVSAVPRKAFEIVRFRRVRSLLPTCLTSCAMYLRACNVAYSLLRLSIP